MNRQYLEAEFIAQSVQKLHLFQRVLENRHRQFDEEEYDMLKRIFEDIDRMFKPKNNNKRPSSKLKIVVTDAT